jgi:hypothetical protein
MPQDGWYRNKADQCERAAKQAADPTRRAECEHQAKLWRQIADQTADNERARRARLGRV